MIPELRSVRILVTRFALLRCSFELNVVFAGQRLVALAAGDRPVCSEQGEFCFGVVEACHIDPRARVMAGFAAERGPIRPAPGHAVAKFSVVRVLMAGSARPIGKVKGQDFVLAMRQLRFVTFIARNSRMGTGQGKLRFLMQRDRKKTAVKILNRMTVLTAIIMGRPGELPVMRVLVTVGAIRELYLVDGFFSGGEMTLRALHRRVFAFQGVAGGLVLVYAERRRLPALDFVTFPAFTLRRASGKLPVVNIFVAVHTIRKSQRLFEVSSGVARDAVHLGVRAKKRKLGLGVIERKPRQHFLPTDGGMAFFAALLEASMMGIDMAIAAICEFHVLEPRRAAGHVRLVAFFAFDLRVQAGQGVACLGMIELLGGFPIVHIVAAFAVLPELPFVRILVASNAIGRNSEVRRRSILAF